MSLFYIKHKFGIHEILDLKKNCTNIELRTTSNETLHIIIVTDESYTVYDDRFAGASKQLSSIEAFDINSSFRNNDFDHMRELFSNVLKKLFDNLGEYVGKGDLINLDTLRHKISDDFKGVYFKILSDIQLSS